MKIIRNSKEITTLEVDDVVVFGDLKYIAHKHAYNGTYYLLINGRPYNDEIFKILNLKKEVFVEKLGINAVCDCDFPETKSLEALTAIVSALFKEYEKQNEFPKTWEEFCERNPVTSDEYWIETVYSRYCNSLRGRRRDVHMDKNVCVSLQEAEAFTAFMQLRQLRKAYIKDWEPNWDNNDPKYCIMCDSNQFDTINCYHVSCPLSFPTEVLANQFLTNFKDLLEVAKPLL